MSNESHPAPAAPQAEPIADSNADYWLRNRQAILDAIERAGFVLMSNASGFWLHPRGATDAQAEPKREPLPGLAPTHRCPACGALWRQCDDSSWNLRSALCCGLCDDGRVDLVSLLDEPLSDDAISYEHACRSSYESAKWPKRAADFGSFKLGVRFAERAHGIGGSDE